MNDERNPRLGNINQLPLDEAPTAGDGDIASEKVPTRQRTAPASAASGPSHWMWATVLLGILVVVMSAWFYKQITVLQSQMENELSDSTEQLGNLASQLSATDESLNQSSEEITDTLSLHDSEIRKLWAVSNERNKDWIQANQQAVSSLTSGQDRLNQSIAGLRSELEQLDASVSQDSRARSQMQTQIDLMNEAVRQAESRVAEQARVVDSLAAIQGQLETLAQLQSGEGLDGRLMEIEAAINAFDAYRRQVNVRLDKLEAPSP